MYKIIRTQWQFKHFDKCRSTFMFIGVILYFVLKHVGKLQLSSKVHWTCIKTMYIMLSLLVGTCCKIKKLKFERSLEISNRSL